MSNSPKIEFDMFQYLPRCLKLLMRDELRTEQIAKELDLSVPYALVILKRLEDEGKIRRKNGKYYAIGAAAK